MGDNAPTYPEIFMSSLFTFKIFIMKNARKKSLDQFKAVALMYQQLLSIKGGTDDSSTPLPPPIDSHIGIEDIVDG